MNEAYTLPKSHAELQAALQRHLDAITAGNPNRIMAMLAPRLEAIDHAEREAHFQYGVAPWMLNAVSILHGGILSTMMDNSMGVFVRAFTGKSVLTLNLQVSFSAPVLPGTEWVNIRCRITSVTNRFAHLFATAWTEDGGPAATATGIFYLK